MKQGRSLVPWCAAIALIACGALAPLPASAAKSAAATSKSGAAASAKSRAAMRQFTGYVTTIEKSTLTVEKRGKKPASKTFTKHATMSTVGELQKEARVTVYYRDEAGRAVAHRVVVKDEVAQSVEKP